MIDQRIIPCTQVPTYPAKAVRSLKTRIGIIGSLTRYSSMIQNPTSPKIPITRGTMTLADFHGKRTPPAVRPKRKEVALPTKTTMPM